MLSLLQPAHPRAYGERSAFSRLRRPALGSPPHIRGNAGSPAGTCPGGRAHPRAYGENNAYALRTGLIQGSPPRVRGTLADKARYPSKDQKIFSFHTYTYIKGGMSRRLLVYGDPPPVAAGLDASNATSPNTTEPAASEPATPRPFRLSPVPGASCASYIRTASARILRAAFTSRSIRTPQAAHSKTRTRKSSLVFARAPQALHV